MTRPETLDEAQPAAEALHPRLGEPMNVVRLCFMAAEHDDHHLATIGTLLRGA